MNEIHRYGSSSLLSKVKASRVMRRFVCSTNLSSQDAFQRYLANAVDFAVVSTGYRLAPEYPFP